MAKSSFNLGNALKAQEQFQEAAVSYRHALDLQPQTVDAWVMLAEVLLSLVQLDPAHEACQQALKLAPNTIECLLIMGSVLEAKQNLAVKGHFCSPVKSCRISRPKASTRALPGASLLARNSISLACSI